MDEAGQEKKIQIEAAKREAAHWEKVIRGLNADMQRIRDRIAKAEKELARCTKEATE